MPKTFREYSAAGFLTLIAQLINGIGQYSALPYFYRRYTTQTSGVPVDPSQAANIPIIDSNVTVRYTRDFILDNLDYIYKPNAEGVKQIPFSFNVEALTQQHWLELFISPLRFGADRRFDATQLMSVELKSLVYAAMLKLQELSRGKIKFYEAQQITNGPAIFIVNGGKSASATAYHSIFRPYQDFSHRSVVCLRERETTQKTLGTILHELMHVIGVKELREHPHARSILRQKSGAFSSVMFYHEERTYTAERDSMQPFAPKAAFVGEIDKALIDAITHAQTSPNPDTKKTGVLITELLKQYSLSLCSSYVLAFLSNLKNSNDQPLLDKKTVTLIAGISTVMLMWYLESSDEMIALQACVTFLQYARDYLSTSTGNNTALFLELFMLPVSLMSIIQHADLLYTENTAELLVKWAALPLASIQGGYAGEAFATLISPYLPQYQNQEVEPNLTKIDTVLVTGKKKI